jgi:hypothetical protein
MNSKWMMMEMEMEIIVDYSVVDVMQYSQFVYQILNVVFEFDLV